VTDKENDAIVVELILRQGVGLDPEDAEKFETGVYAMFDNIYRSGDKRPPIEVVWSTNCLSGYKVQVDVVIRFRPGKSTNLNAVAAIDFWIRIVGSWVQIVPYFAVFGLGIVVIDQSGQLCVRLSRTAISCFASTTRRTLEAMSP